MDINCNLAGNKAATGALRKTAVPLTVHPRRIGTFTFGTALILLGLMVPALLIYRDKALWLLQLSPLILLLLGIEVLVYAIRSKGGKYRYDGLSVFMAVAVTLGTLLGSGAVYLVNKAVAYAGQVDEARNRAESTAERALSAFGCTGDVSGFNNASDEKRFYAFMSQEKAADWPIGISIQIYTIGGDQTPDEETTEEVFSKIAAACGGNKSIRYLSLQLPRQGEAYSVHLNGEAIENVNVNDIKSRIEYNKMVLASAQSGS